MRIEWGGWEGKGRSQTEINSHELMPEFVGMNPNTMYNHEDLILKKKKIYIKLLIFQKIFLLLSLIDCLFNLIFCTNSKATNYILS